MPLGDWGRVEGHSGDEQSEHREFFGQWKCFVWYMIMDICHCTFAHCAFAQTIRAQRILGAVKMLCMIYDYGYMSLYICPKNVGHQEWT